MGYLVFAGLLAGAIVVCLLVGRSMQRGGRDEKDADKGALGIIFSFVGKIVLPIAFVLYAAWASVYQVPAGYVGLVYRFGAIVGQTTDGFQVVWPWESIRDASARVQGHKFHGRDRLDSFSQETQQVFVEATINIRVSPENIQALYRGVGPEYFDILVRPRVQQAFKDETVKYRSVDIAPHREQIRHVVRERLTKELRTNSILVEDLLLDNIAFRKEFQSAIERKQTESQNALAEEQRVQVAKQRAAQAVETARGEAQATVIRATAQAEANHKLAVSITPQLVQWQALQKWNGILPRVTGGAMPLVNLDEKK